MSIRVTSASTGDAVSARPRATRSQRVNRKVRRLMEPPSQVETTLLLLRATSLTNSVAQRIDFRSECRDAFCHDTDVVADRFGEHFRMAPVLRQSIAKLAAEVFHFGRDSHLDISQVGPQILDGLAGF